ncbi:T9SS type A sorting domain-containing protein [Labilibacter sediminis]|nr:T9SS type A sorting domain-containing protein [Labilibacter sediminis]
MCLVLFYEQHQNKIMNLKSTCILILLALFSNVFANSFYEEIESEQTVLSGSHELANNENASGGVFTKLFNSSPQGSLQFTISNIAEEGTYKLYIYSFNGGAPTDVNMSLNSAPNTLVTLQASNWAYQGEAQYTMIKVDLQAGNNTIAFAATAGPNVLIDKFVLTSAYNTYYVSSDGDDANDGTLEAPWKTLDKVTDVAANDANGGFLLPGDKVLFRCGDYFEGNLIVNRSGTKDEPIELSSYGEGELPIISGSGNTIAGDYFEVIKLLNTSYIKVSNLWVKNDRKNTDRYTWGETKAYGILVTANKWGGVSRGLEFRDLKISNVYGVSMPDEFNSLNVTGLRFESDSNEVGQEISIKDVLVEDCEFTKIGKAGVWSIHKGKNVADNDSVNCSMNFVIRNNIFYQTGGSGVILSKVCNALVENNDFDHTGHSDVSEPRLVGRGSGMWVFSSNNIMAQYNRSYSVRGSGDSYGMHIDFGNKNIIYQYNYSEDSEGGFCEVLGDNHNVAYRFNVSVNDGFRDFHGNTIWTSGYVGSGNTPVPSNGVYVYNNTIYLEENFKPDFTIFSKDTYIYNNIFKQTGSGIIGENVSIDIQDGGEFVVSNNLFDGNINPLFSNYDSNPVNEQPMLKHTVEEGINSVNIMSESPAIGAGTIFPEPQFPMAGKGIFTNIPLYPTTDAYGNGVDVRNVVPNIGANNAWGVSTAIKPEFKNDNIALRIFPNPVNDMLKVSFEEGDIDTDISIFDVQGKMVYKKQCDLQGVTEFEVSLPGNIKNGIYFLKVGQGGSYQTERFILYR